MFSNWTYLCDRCLTVNTEVCEDRMKAGKQKKYSTNEMQRSHFEATKYRNLFLENLNSNSKTNFVKTKFFYCYSLFYNILIDLFAMDGI